MSPTVGEAINAPCLTAAPSARVGVSLHCALCDDSAGRRVVINDLKRRPCKDVVKGGQKVVQSFGKANRQDEHCSP